MRERAVFYMKYTILELMAQPTPQKNLRFCHRPRACCRPFSNACSMLARMRIGLSYVTVASLSYVQELSRPITSVLAVYPVWNIWLSRGCASYMVVGGLHHVTVNRLGICVHNQATYTRKKVTCTSGFRTYTQLAVVLDDRVVDSKVYARCPYRHTTAAVSSHLCS